MNAFMFVVNLLMAVRVVSTQDKSKIHEESLVLKELKEELDKYYPYRTFATIAAYMVPFTAFFRISFRLVEMYLFFQKNQNAKMFDYMVYKYSYDIEKAKYNDK